MKYKVELTKHADADLRNIYEYIAFDLHSPETAIKQLERIEKAILSLSELPERFPLFDRAIENKRTWQLAYR